MENFPLMESPVDELFMKHLIENQSIENVLLPEEELASDNEYSDLENILSQTQLNGLDLDAWSTTSNGPQSPHELQDSDKHITDEDLMNLPIRELNKRLRCLPKEEVKVIRRRRRSLKNRGYATSCRQRRVRMKEVLETQNQRLKSQLREVKEKLTSVTKERDTFKSKYDQLSKLVAWRLSSSS